MSKSQFPTDPQLSRALRQAALRLEQVASELETLRSHTAPIIDRLTVHDFIPLIRKATTNDQIRAVVDCLDNCFWEDGSIMAEEDWPVLTRVVSACKKPAGKCPPPTGDKR